MLALTYICLCLLLLSRKLLMDLTLACKRSLPAFLIIFLAFSVLIIVFNLILTGVIPLLIHLSVKCSGSCCHNPLSLAFPIPLVGAELLSHICLIRFCVDFSFFVSLSSWQILWNRTFVEIRLAFIKPTVGLHHV